LNKLPPLIAFLVLILGTTGYAIAHGNVDQFTFGTGTGSTNIPTNEVIGQSFTPTVDNIVAVGIEIQQDATVSAEPLTVRIRDGEGLGGTELGITQTHTGLPGAGNIALVHYDFPASIALIPGNLYTITVVLNDNNDFGEVEWQFDVTNPYPEGIRIGIPDLDLGFQTLFEEIIEDDFCDIFPDDPKCTVGGEIIPIETTSLILAGVQSFSWMIPVVLSVLGIGLFVASRKSES